MEEKPIEIKQVSEREIWVGESRFYLGEDDILYETVVGEQNERTATEMRKVTNKLQNMVEGKVNVLIDLNKAGTPSSGARKNREGCFIWTSSSCESNRIFCNWSYQKKGYSFFQDKGAGSCVAQGVIYGYTR